MLCPQRAGLPAVRGLRALGLDSTEAPAPPALHEIPERAEVHVEVLVL